MIGDRQAEGVPAPRPAAWWAGRLGAEVPVVRLTEADWQHVLVGRLLPSGRARGGHRAGAQRPFKTEFPPDWSDQRIRGAIQAVVSEPQGAVLRGTTVRRYGVVDRVLIVVDTRPDGDGQYVLLKAYPHSGDGVRETNASGRAIAPRPLDLGVFQYHDGHDQSA